MNKKRKPCPACGFNLELPVEYLDAVKNIRLEVEKFVPVIIKDYIENELKPVLFELADSHRRLSQAEYDRNPLYNNDHFSHKAEESLIAFLSKESLLDEFLSAIVQNESHKKEE